MVVLKLVLTVVVVELVMVVVEVVVLVVLRGGVAPVAVVEVVLLSHSVVRWPTPQAIQTLHH
jgi:hypothetical protein